MGKTQKPSAQHALGLKTKKKPKKTLKRNPEAKCMVCTWLKKEIRSIHADVTMEDTDEEIIHETFKDER